jgi:protein SCO1/2/putative membrane protein
MPTPSTSGSTRLPAKALIGVLLLAVGGCLWQQSTGVLDDLGPLSDFALIERSGQTVRRQDLAGQVWVAAFVFTRCAGPCTQISGTMARLQHDLAGYDEVRLVSITVDPEYDRPPVLQRYASRYGADENRWLFLTGAPGDVYTLIGRGFHLTAQPNEGANRTPGNEVMHDTRLALVDGGGHIRGYFDGTDQAAIPKLERAVAYLVWQTRLPAVNATLNGTSAVLLGLGYLAVRRRWLTTHKACMLLALGVSALFLASYLYYHIVVKKGEPTTFTGGGWARGVYFSILLSHTILAAAVAFLAPITAYYGLCGRLARHVRLARWTLPLWFYVSTTGVVVYWMLYRLYPSP